MDEVGQQVELNWTRLCHMGQAVIEAEARAVSLMSARIDAAFAKACELCLKCQGRIVVTGIGKSGHVGNKIAATLASTGSPAFFLHAAEASHGDLGMLKSDDVVLAISNSGNTKEIVNILRLIEHLGAPLISMTGNPSSQLAKQSTVHLDVSVEGEACPLGLAPTASTTAALAVGDALAITLLEARGFSTEDFARSHPGGRLGRRLLLRAKDIMHAGDTVPRVKAGTKIIDALLEITNKGLGITAVVNADEQLVGVFTDGDLRRCLDEKVDVNQATIDEYMTTNCISITEDMLAIKALELMQTKRINALFVLSEAEGVIGALNMHDLLQAEIS